MSEKSQTTRTSKNSSEKSCSQQEYFARVVKDRRTGKNGVKFLIGLCDLPLDNDQEDVWGPDETACPQNHLFYHPQVHLNR